MTREMFPVFIEEVVFPMCPGIGPEPENNYCLHLDGDNSHLALNATSLKQFEDYFNRGLLFVMPPPNNTHRINEQDDGDGPLHCDD